MESSCTTHQNHIIQEYSVHLKIISRLWPYLFLFIWVLVLMGRTLGLKTLYWGDLLLYFHPMYHLAREGFLVGKIPLWNPYTLCGQPFVGNPQIGLFFPLVWMLGFMSTWKWIDLATTLSLFLGACYLYRFLKRLGMYSVSAGLGAAIWMGSSPILGRVQFTPMLFALCCMPAILYYLDLALESGTMQNRIYLSLAFTAIIMAAHPQVTYLTILLCIFLIYTRFSKAKKENYNKISSVVIALTIAMCLCAVQILPMLELMTQSARQNLGVWQANRFHLIPGELLNFLFPDFYGNPATSNYWGQGNAWEPALFIGWVPLILIVVAVRCRRNDVFIRSWLYLLIACVWAALGVNGGLYILLFHILPGLNKFHDPARFLIMSDIAFVVLAAKGFDIMMASTKESRQKLILPIVYLCTLVPLLWFAGDWLPTARISSLQKYSHSLELSALHTSGNDFLPYNGIYADGFIRDGYRDYGESEGKQLKGEINSFNPNLNIASNIYSASGYEPLPLNGVAKINWLAKSALQNNNANVGNYLSLMGVKIILVPLYYKISNPALMRVPIQSSTNTYPMLKMYLNRDYHHLFWTVKRAVYEKNDLQTLGLLASPEFNPNTMAVINSARQSSTNSNFTQEDLNITFKRKIDEFMLDIPRHRNRILLVAAIPAYPGWKAMCNNRQIPLSRTDEGIMSMQLPPGTQHLRIQYRPFTVLLGLYISLVSMLLIITMLLILRNGNIGTISNAKS